MECILICLAGLYFEGAVGYVDIPSSHVKIYSFQLEGKQPITLVSGARMHDYNSAANPMGRVAIGHEWNPSAKIRIDLQVRHESWLGTGKDKGTNSAWASVRVRPWAGQ